MIGRAGYDLLRVGLRVTLQLWPLWLFWGAWDRPDAQWVDYLRTVPANQPGGSWTNGYTWAVRVWPTVALLGPALVMGFGVMLHRIQIGSRAMALAGVGGMGPCVWFVRCTDISGRAELDTFARHISANAACVFSIG